MSTVSTTLADVLLRLNETTLELESLRAAFDVQFKRIAAMQAELDSLPHARRRRRALLTALTPIQPGNGNGRTHS